MAIVRVRVTPVGIAANATTITFGVLPTVGDLIVVAMISFSQASPQSFTVTDNQGNTYHLASDSGNSNGSNTFIYYAFNVAAAGTFTITVTMINGSGAHGFATLGIEYSGLGASDPIAGAGGSNSTNPPTCTTSATGAAEVAVVAAMSTFQLNFVITAITVDGSAPTWVEEYERIPVGFLDLGGEIDSRVVGSGAAQAATWTITSGGSPGNPTCAIAAFAATPPASAARLTQVSRQVLEQDDTGAARLTQVCRQVLYPFTCSPGPSPTPATGCPEVVITRPVTGARGCDDTLS